jgi:HK97 family phage major capsid protein
MDDNLKKELDKIGNIVDERIEKAFNQAKDNAKGEMESSLKSEIDNLTTQYVEKSEALNKRMDEMEMAAKKTLSGATPQSFKSAIHTALKDGAIDAMLKGNANAARFEVKADMSLGADVTGVVAGQTIVDQIKYDPSRSTHIRSLLPLGSTDAQTIRFPKETAYSDGAAATAEAAAFGQSDFDLAASTVNVEKIGTYMRITGEMLDDIKQLTSYLSARVPEKVLSVEDNEILNGDGSSPNLDGLFTDGAAFVVGAGGAFYQAIESANEFDVLTVALNQLALSNYQADTILLNPTDLHKMILLKSTTNEYLRNQIFSGLQPTINGIPVTLNTAVTAGKFLVGNLRQASQLWIRENLAVEFSREDSDNFQKNFVTVRAMERVALTNYLPNAIVQGTFSTAKAALETA